MQLAYFTCLDAHCLSVCCLLAAIAFAMQLNKVSNFKHKSWYVHMIVFVVPQQIAEHGDTWVYSTMAIESSGARLKRYWRVTVSWRKAVNGWSSYAHTDKASGAKMQRTQRYMSSAVQQLLMKACAMEESWHSLAPFVTPEKGRLQQYLLTRKLKCDVGEISSRQSSRAVFDQAAQEGAISDSQPAFCAEPPALAFFSRMFSTIKGIGVFWPLPKL
eukprot:6202182-Pleurochrysis_carterae.AAC.1